MRNRINTIINCLKDNFSDYTNFIGIDFEIKNKQLVISIYPKFNVIWLNKDIKNRIEIIEAELIDNSQYARFNNDYVINVYNTLDKYVNRKQ